MSKAKRDSNKFTTNSQSCQLTIELNCTSAYFVTDNTHISGGSEMVGVHIVRKDHSGVATFAVTSYNGSVVNRPIHTVLS